MDSSHSVVSSVDGLLAVVGKAETNHIVIQGQLTNVPGFALAPGQVLEGEDQQAIIRFAPNQDGLRLSTDNTVCNLRLETTPEYRAIYNDTQVSGLGVIRLADLVTIGQVQILARDQVRSGNVEVAGLDVVAADTRSQGDRPEGFGVHVIQGAFTLWNMQADPQVVVTADLLGLSAGRASAPVIGSGVFVSGPGFDQGCLSVRRLETGPIFSDGRIPPGTPDVITGGVFTVHGAFVDSVRNLGPVTTYGVNDMVLDNWGQVDRWEADAKITSFGPSGIGFVNFGGLGWLKVNAPIETFGQGARGFNLYAGTLNRAEFERITTHADGAVGVQVSKPMGPLHVNRGIETYGATGDSLVKGLVVSLSAVALSIKPGGSVAEVVIAGGVITHGKDIAPLEVHGEIGSLQISGGIRSASN